MAAFPLAFDNSQTRSVTIKLRYDWPPILTEQDYRDLPDLGSVDERPWIPEFPKKRLDYYKSYGYKRMVWEGLQVPDPAWLDKDRNTCRIPGIFCRLSSY